MKTNYGKNYSKLAIENFYENRNQTISVRSQREMLIVGIVLVGLSIVGLL